MENVRLSMSPLLGERLHSPAAEFCHAVAYEAVQSPLNGVAQLFDKCGFTEPVLPSIQFLDALPPPEFGSARWYARQVGSAVGMSVPFLAIHKTLNFGTRLAFGKPGVELPASKLRVIGDAALTGAIFDGVFRPVSPTDKNFWDTRILNSLTGAATMSTFAASTIGIRSLSKVSGLARSVLGNEIVSASLAGVPAGFVHAEASALTNEGRFATKKELYEAMLTFAAVGGTLSLAKQNLVVDSNHRTRCLIADTQLETQREALLQRRLDLEAERANIKQKLTDLGPPDSLNVIEISKLNSDLSANKTLLKQTRYATGENLRQNIEVLKQLLENDRSLSSRIRAMEIGMQHSYGYMPETLSRRSPFWIRDPKLDCSVPLEIKGKVPFRDGMDVVEHTIPSIEKPSLLELTYEPYTTYRGRANYRYTGHVILNFNDFETRVPVFDHEMGHVLDARKVSPNETVNKLVQDTYVEDLNNQTLTAEVKSVLLKTDYVHPRPEQALPIEAGIPDKLRFHAYHSSRAEVIAESWKIFLESKRVIEAGEPPLTYEQLLDRVTGPHRQKAMQNFKSTYSVLAKEVFEPLYQEEMLRRLPWATEIVP